tara:strand:+ start:134 stop:646 length:513 start_codon:yes stop_codon:yes gene_type:complete
MARKDKITRLNLHDAPSYKKVSAGNTSFRKQQSAIGKTKYVQDYDIMEQYEKAGGKVYDEPTPSPISHLVKTDAKDYDRGYIRRYFVVKYDGTSTTEVSKKWMADNGDTVPNIYEKFAIQWFVTDYSKEPIEMGMKSPKAQHRNEFIVGKISNEFLKEELRDNYIEFFMG